MAVLRFTVETGAGQRLDRGCALRNPGITRSRLKSGARRVLVNGKESKLSRPVRVGDEVMVEWDDPVPCDILPEDIELRIIFENGDVTVVNKRMVVHPAAGNWHGTLVNAILYHCLDLEGVGGVHRPGIVHRLDKDTSGVIVVAKNDAAQRSLQAQFKARQVHKRYLALIFGQIAPPRGEIDAAIGRDVRDRKRMAVVPLSQGRRAITRYETLEVFKSNITGERLALLACRPLTGRTHQIRVHLAHVRHPIVGDEVYGGRRKLPVVCPRQFLHAERLAFRLPGTEQEVEFVAPLPADLQAVLDRLRLGD